MPTLSSFKSHLRALYRPTQKQVFGIHDPEGLKYIFQLRLGLSPLRSHKFRHNFLDTPNDKCLCKTGKETTEHFLFKCPYYTSQRLVLAENVIPLLPPHNLCFLQKDAKLYLYGHANLSESDNRTIILETIKFIKASNRFDWAPSPTLPLPFPFPFPSWSLRCEHMYIFRLYVILFYVRAINVFILLFCNESRM